MPTRHKLPKSSGNVYWPGEPVPLETMLECFNENFASEKISGRIHYAQAYPGYFRTIENLFTFRICLYSGIRSPMKIRGAFDGVLETRECHSGDVVLGSYNAGNNCITENSDYSLSEFSVIFHLHHIRFHYGETCGGVWGRDIYYHTPKPADGILLLMVRALDSILHETGSERDARSRPLLMAIREQLRHELELAASRTSSPCHPVLLRVRGFLENNFHCGINCSTVCDELNINRSYASTLFHHEFGISMSDYLLHLRMNAAKFLLSSRQELKIAEIADYCGFQDPNYFIRVFRQQTEMTPGKYRDLHKPKN